MSAKLPDPGVTCPCKRHFPDRQTARDGADHLRVARATKRARWDVQACPTFDGVFTALPVSRAKKLRASRRYRTTDLRAAG